VHVLSGDQPGAALVGQVRPEPIDRDSQTIAEADQEVDVGHTPDEPGEAAGQPCVRSSPDCRDPGATPSHSAAGDAATPAAQIRVRLSMRSSSNTAPQSPQRTTLAPSRNSTPSRSRPRAAVCDKPGGKLANTRGPASIRMMRRWSGRCGGNRAPVPPAPAPPGRRLARPRLGRRR